MNISECLAMLMNDVTSDRHERYASPSRTFISHVFTPEKSIFVLAMNLPYSFVPASGKVKVEAQSL